MLSIVNLFEKKYTSKEKISILTCYDYTFAKLLNSSNIDCILVGDTLGMVIQGNESTLPVSVDDMIYHCRAVKRGAPDKPIICDMPFMSYQISIEEAIHHAGRLMVEGLCHAIKLEGADEYCLQLIKRLVAIGIPVMAHIGLTPQSVHTLGGFKVQGREEHSRDIIFKEALNLEKAGVFSILMEMVPAELGSKISNAVGVPTIGIGAGNGTGGQVLVLQDMLGMDADFNPKYLKKFANLSAIITNAANQYAKEVMEGSFPDNKNFFK